jgi:hypothetical protein
MAKKVNLDVSERLDITCRRGDSFSITLTLKDSSGTALPLATDNYSFVMQVRTGINASKAKGTAGLVLSTQELGPKAIGRDGVQRSFEPFVVDNSGNLTITATAETMRKIPGGLYVYDIQQIKPNTTTGVDEHTTILRGNFRVNEDVSDATPEARR